MSGQLSPSTRKVYGLERVCRIWCFPRSSFYSRRHGESQTARPSTGRKRGPKTEISDDRLLEAIKTDLETSPFTGEGHRKVWARLRILEKIRVGKDRILRIMRENNILSPRRVRQGTGKTHDGTITTTAPNIMWGTDGVRVFTVEEGWVWIFSALEHWNAECVGYHVCKFGSRYAALEPIAMGLKNSYGSVDADAARGLSLRMDNGSQYLSDHFLNQIRFWGIQPSFAFVEEPETNGVAERFNRTLKEQAIFGRIFKNTEDLRSAVSAFVADYNNHWRLEKLGYQTPVEARKNFCLETAA